MPSATYNLKFDGYWREMNSASIPDESGIYCVYTCDYDVTAGGVSIDQLIYIGEAEKVRNRIKDHERKSDWEKSLKIGQELCYSFAPIVSGRERAEAALINRRKPKYNTEHKDNFSYDETNVETSGRKAELSSSFSVG